MLLDAQVAFKNFYLPPWLNSVDLFFLGAPVMDDNTQPQVHVRCSDVNAVCEARKMVRSYLSRVK